MNKQPLENNKLDEVAKIIALGMSQMFDETDFEIGSNQIKEFEKNLATALVQSLKEVE